tara:strand:+ start:40760 stop:41128 length:369 start_codon:yes stop_codon:yes gene_type:complete
MDKEQFQEIKRENNCNNNLIMNGGYYTTGILYNETIKDDDVTIDIMKKKIYINNRMSYIGFISYLHNRWYADKQLSRIRIPIRLVSVIVEIKNGWEIINRENILLPSEVKKIYEKILFDEKS